MTEGFVPDQHYCFAMINWPSFGPQRRSVETLNVWYSGLMVGLGDTTRAPAVSTL